jgi:hypothetical protein
MGKGTEGIKKKKGVRLETRKAVGKEGWQKKICHNTRSAAVILENLKKSGNPLCNQH